MASVFSPQALTLNNSKHYYTVLVVVVHSATTYYSECYSALLWWRPLVKLMKYSVVVVLVVRYVRGPSTDASYQVRTRYKVVLSLYCSKRYGVKNSILLRGNAPIVRYFVRVPGTEYLLRKLLRASATCTVYINFLDKIVWCTIAGVATIIWLLRSVPPVRVERESIMQQSVGYGTKSYLRGNQRIDYQIAVAEKLRRVGHLRGLILRR